MEKEIAKKGEVLLYSNGNGKEFVNVVFKDETFWLTQKAMAGLFDVNIPAISKHLKNIFEDGELAEEVVVSEMEIVRREGKDIIRHTCWNSRQLPRKTRQFVKSRMLPTSPNLTARPNDT